MESTWAALDRAQQSFPVIFNFNSLAQGLTVRGTNAHTVAHFEAVHSDPKECTFRTLADAVIAADNPGPATYGATTHTAGFTPAAAFSTTKVAGTKTYAKPRTEKFWCFTHADNFSHGSAACRKPAPNHEKTATKTNPMGGPAAAPSR
mmetsp:Transcript_17644/g.44835  ORF Transcript_17644/g.44835 Transcript_17644/m.44835 type:complete len:148 (+) Transcript_17644:485-928(+)